MITGLSCVALPLSAVIAQEGSKLTRKTAEWKQKCGNAESGSKLWYACQPKCIELSGEWGKFVYYINQELTGLGKPDPNEEKLISDRRKLMEFELNYALHNLKCLGVDSPQCAEEESKLAEEGKTWSNDLAWWSSLRQLDEHGKPIPIKGFDR